MLFNSPIFLFLFVPLFFLAHQAAPQKWQNSVLLAASMAFYAWAEPMFVFVALASALFDFFVVRQMIAAQSRRTRKGWVAAGVIANLAMLVYFKYTNFFLENVERGLASFGFSIGVVWRVGLPIALSFIVFEKITYLVDNYRGVGRPARSVWDYLLYVFFFPKLMAGPIIKYHDIEDQILARRLTPDDFFEGSARFILGLGKKLLIADSVAPLVNEIFALPAAQMNLSTLALGALGFAVQIFFDFSGYSDMAIGLGRVMGFRLLENFRAPYLAWNFTEFWKRWHISLSTWIRDYLYIPLGGNRGSAARTYLNLWICFLLSGLWHGANWTFVLWGAYHGMMLVMDRIFWADFQKRLPNFFNVAITFSLVCVSWVIFRAESVSRLWAILSSGLKFGSLPALERWTGETMTGLAVGLAAAFLPGLAGARAASAAFASWAWREELKLSATVVLLALALSKAANNTFQAFLYFRF